MARSLSSGDHPLLASLGLLCALSLGCSGPARSRARAEVAPGSATSARPPEGPSVEPSLEALAQREARARALNEEGLRLLREGAEGSAESRAEGAERFARACALELGVACVNLGSCLEGGGAEGRERARALYERACEAGEEAGCHRLAFLLSRGEGAEPARAASLYERGCASGLLESCANLAQLFLEGRGVSRDPIRALALLRGACDRAHGPSCLRLAEAHAAAGPGARRDLPYIALLRHRACALGEREACAEEAP